MGGWCLNTNLEHESPPPTRPRGPSRRTTTPRPVEGRDRRTRGSFRVPNTDARHSRERRTDGRGRAGRQDHTETSSHPFCPCRVASRRGTRAREEDRCGATPVTLRGINIARRARVWGKPRPTFGRTECGFLTAPFVPLERPSALHPRPRRGPTPAAPRVVVVLIDTTEVLSGTPRRRAAKVIPSRT